MRNYRNKAMEELAAQLIAGLKRLRKGYIDSAEALLHIINPTRQYPYEFVVYRITGFRPPPDKQNLSPIPGTELRADVLNLMLDVSESFNLHTSDYASRVYDTKAMARHFGVSTRTIRRWRHAGLPARALIFPDGRRRVAFLESSVKWFTQNRRRQVMRSMKFTQVSRSERADILRRAARMARFTRCSLMDIARRLAARTGRAVETIRYTIRNHDLKHPDKAIFPYLSAPLADQDKNIIYRCFLQGISVQQLAKKYGRTRGSIYRIVNEMRAVRLLKRPITYMYNPEFDSPDADEKIQRGGQAVPDSADSSKKTSRTQSDKMPSYLKSLYRVPLLDASAEKTLFRKYNYLKYKADRLRRNIDINRVRSSQLKQIESLMLQANAVKNHIIRANLRLVVSIAKRHLGGPKSMFELISDGNVSLMRAVEKFDYSRGNRFSTYASWVIMRNFARSVPKEKYQLDRFSTGHDDILEVAAALQTYDPDELNIPELRESLDTVLAQLAPSERSVLVQHYGLDRRDNMTLAQLGKQMDLSKERVRQIEIRALRKLRRILNPQKADLLS